MLIGMEGAKHYTWRLYFMCYMEKLMKQITKIGYAIIGLAFTLVVQAENNIILQEGDFIITREDVESYIAVNVPVDSRDRVVKDNGVFREIAENIYIVRKLAAEAERDLEFDRELMQWSNEFQQKRKLMAMLLEKRTTPSLESSHWEQMAKEVYIAEEEEFSAPETVHASHILITTKERTQEEAKAIIEKLKARIAAGEGFASIATAESEDPSAKMNAGDLGFFSRGEMVGIFEKAAFSMTTPGELSEILESKFGYHIIQFHESKPAGKQAFETVKESIIDSLKVQRKQQMHKDIMIGLRSDKALEWDFDLLKQVQMKYQTAAGLSPGPVLNAE